MAAPTQHPPTPAHLASTAHTEAVRLADIAMRVNNPVEATAITATAQVHATLAVAHELAALRTALCGTDPFATRDGGALGEIAACIERYVGGAW